jgi:hypothetical protein
MSVQSAKEQVNVRPAKPQGASSSLLSMRAGALLYSSLQRANLYFHLAVCKLLRYVSLVGLK